MNKKYEKPILNEINVMALENVSAFSSFDEFSSFATDITTYQFSSGLKEVANNEEV